LDNWEKKGLVYRKKDSIEYYEKGKAGWYCKKDGFQCYSKKNDGVDYVEKIDVVHYYVVGINFVLVVRECHGFVNPCGSTPRVRTGTGTGWGLVTLAQPAPMVRAPSGHSGFCT